MFGLLLLGLLAIGFARRRGARWMRWSFALPLVVCLVIVAQRERRPVAPTPFLLTPTVTATVEVVP